VRETPTVQWPTPTLRAGLSRGASLWRRHTSLRGPGAGPRGGLLWWSGPFTLLWLSWVAEGGAPDPGWWGTDDSTQTPLRPLAAPLVLLRLVARPGGAALRAPPARATSAGGMGAAARQTLVAPQGPQQPLANKEDAPTRRWSVAPREHEPRKHEPRADAQRIATPPIAARWIDVGTAQRGSVAKGSLGAKAVLGEWTGSSRLSHERVTSADALGSATVARRVRIEVRRLERPVVSLGSASGSSSPEGASTARLLAPPRRPQAGHETALVTRSEGLVEAPRTMLIEGRVFVEGAESRHAPLNPDAAQRQIGPHAEPMDRSQPPASRVSAREGRAAQPAALRPLVALTAPRQRLNPAEGGTSRRVALSFQRRPLVVVSAGEGSSSAPSDAPTPQRWRVAPPRPSSSPRAPAVQGAPLSPTALARLAPHRVLLQAPTPTITVIPIPAAPQEIGAARRSINRVRGSPTAPPTVSATRRRPQEATQRFAPRPQSPREEQATISLTRQGLRWISAARQASIVVGRAAFVQGLDARVSAREPAAPRAAREVLGGRAPTPRAPPSVMVQALRSVSAALEGLADRLRPTLGPALAPASSAAEGGMPPSSLRVPSGPSRRVDRGQAPGVSAPPQAILPRPAASSASAPSPSPMASAPPPAFTLTSWASRPAAADVRPGTPAPPPSLPGAMPLVAPPPARAARAPTSSRTPAVRAAGPTKWRAAARAPRTSPSERAAASSSAQRARLPPELLALLSESSTPSSPSSPPPTSPRPALSDPPVLERELVRALKTMTRSDAQAIDLIKDIERRLAELRRFDALRRI
jgi:hypothetical protein